MCVSVGWDRTLAARPGGAGYARICTNTFRLQVRGSTTATALCGHVSDVLVELPDPSPLADAIASADWGEHILHMGFSMPYYEYVLDILVACYCILF